MEINENLLDLIQSLEKRIQSLEEENTETTNTLYQLWNSIEAVDSRIDIILSENHNLKEFTLDK
ncbi:MAG: hypothetical protein EB127_24560 [Alphaproteobacteria bacterium]|nr:hypothetical protein [Alphaproteobacteria bacterium]